MKNPDEFLASYNRYREALSKANKNNKAVILDALAEAEITHVHIEFDGVGDQGQIEYLTALCGEQQAHLPIIAVTLQQVSWGDFEVRNVEENLERRGLWTIPARCRGAHGEPRIQRALHRRLYRNAQALREAIMAHPYHHSLSSVRKWGGSVADYQRIHDWFDESKKIIADFRHRALRHHAEGIFMAETIFGATITLSSGRVIPTRWIGEQHVREDLGFIPSFADWVKAIRPLPWMGRAQRLEDMPEITAQPAA